MTDLEHRVILAIISIAWPLSLVVVWLNGVGVGWDRAAQEPRYPGAADADRGNDD